jgi:hypothetical protein
MPPIKNIRIHVWINEYPDTFTTDGMVVYCQISEKEVPCSKKFQNVQHIRTATHIAASEKKSKTTHTSGSQTLITQSRTNSITCKDNFSNDLCEALIASNIPLKKLSNLKFRSFLKKYCTNQTYQTNPFYEKITL